LDSPETLTVNEGPKNLVEKDVWSNAGVLPSLHLFEAVVEQENDSTVVEMPGPLQSSLAYRVTVPLGQAFVELKLDTPNKTGFELVIHTPVAMTCPSHADEREHPGAEC
jgi:hypothetical protein